MLSLPPTCVTQEPSRQNTMLPFSIQALACSGVQETHIEVNTDNFCWQINFVHHLSLEITSLSCQIPVPFLTVSLHGLVLLALGSRMTSTQPESLEKLSFSYSFHPRFPGPIALSSRTHSKLDKNETPFIHLFLTIIDCCFSLPRILCHFHLLVFWYLATSVSFVQTFVYVRLTLMTAFFHPSRLTLLNRHEFSTFHHVYN